MNAPIRSLIHQAVRYFQSGNLAQAEATLRAVWQDEPDNFDALHILGVICVHQNRRQEARGFFERAISVDSGKSFVHFNLATVLSESGHDVEALPHFEKAVSLAPEDPDSWVNYGKCLGNLQRLDEAASCFERALAINPNHFHALINHGALLAELCRNHEALSCFDRALAINPQFPAGWLNKGNLLATLKRSQEALACYDRALQLDSRNAEVWFSKGKVLVTLRRFDEALTHFDQAIALDSGNAEFWYSKGNALNELKRHSEALAHYDRVIVLNPEHDRAYGNRLSTRMAVCDWEGTGAQLTELADRVEKGRPVSAPFDLLCFFDSPALHRKAAGRYAQNFPENRVLGAFPARASKGKIRIGYFSRDFQNHATSFLAAELFELHDRSKFEVFAFSFGPETNDRMRNRLLSSFDQFIDISRKSDREAAQLARELEIDIAVDLQGYQTEHRTGIFAHRAAPVQVNYLAYPGTMAAEYIDYLVADNTLITPENRPYYSEKVVFLPNSYQVNDRQRVIADRLFTREELGLPQNGFVFCCFNNTFKISLQTFDGWMAILKAVEGSVLWLFDGGQAVAQNLRKEAEARGIAAERLVFASYMDLPEHLARHRQADLFLDALPYNAHTTASDALWAGLPLLTCAGESFASRVAASLLNALGLPELITDSREDYVQLAIGLAKQPEKLAEVKQKLAENRLVAPLFDTPLFARHLEAAYSEMMRRYQAGLPPEDFQVGR